VCACISWSGGFEVVPHIGLQILSVEAINPTTQHAHHRLLPFFSSGVTSRNGDFGAESTPPVQ
ncbi:MAG: hypothetical protein WBW79_00275, partial [Desulfocapsaceae bacterium]